MSLVYLAVTNPWLPLFIGFDEKDSGESAGEVTEQLDLQSNPTRRVRLKHRSDLSQISLLFLIRTSERVELNYITTAAL